MKLFERLSKSELATLIGTILDTVKDREVSRVLVRLICRNLSTATLRDVVSSLSESHGDTVRVEVMRPNPFETAFDIREVFSPTLATALALVDLTHLRDAPDVSEVCLSLVRGGTDSLGVQFVSEKVEGEGAADSLIRMFFGKEWSG